MTALHEIGAAWEAIEIATASTVQNVDAEGRQVFFQEVNVKPAADALGHVLRYGDAQILTPGGTLFYFRSTGVSATLAVSGAA